MQLALVHFFANSQTVKTQTILQPIWKVKNGINPKFNWKNKVKFGLKWLKFLLYSFILVVFLWGCLQSFTQPYTNTNPTVGQGLEYGYPAGITGDYRFDVSWEHTGKLYFFYDFTFANGPFIGFFVYPLARVSLAILYAMTPALSYGGFNTLFLIIFVLLFMRLLIFWPSLKSSLLNEKTLEHQGAIAEINGKYAKISPNDKAAKYRKNQELREYNKKHGLNPLASLGSSIVTLPVFLVILKLFGILRPLKATVLFGIWDLSQIPFNAIFRNFTNGGWTYCFLLLFVIPAQYFSGRLPQYLSKRRNRKALAYSKQGIEQMKKTNRIQNVTTLIFVIFPLFISTGIGVYYFFSSLFTIAQTIIIHHIIEKKRKSGYDIDFYLMRFGIIDSTLKAKANKLIAK